jgi:hypothetical protein
MTVVDEIAQFVRGVGGYPVSETREGTDHPTDDAGWVSITLPYGLTRRLFAVQETKPKDNIMDQMPLSYVYVGQLQEAHAALTRASDQRQDGATAAAEVATARQRIENVYRLHGEGVTS